MLIIPHADDTNANFRRSIMRTHAEIGKQATTDTETNAPHDVEHSETIYPCTTKATSTSSTPPSNDHYEYTGRNHGLNHDPFELTAGIFGYRPQSQHYQYNTS